MAIPTNVQWEPAEIFSKETVVKDRNFRNTSGADQAVGINGQKVTFQNCKFLSNSNTSVMAWGGSSPKFEGCEFYGDPAPGQQYAKINAWQPKSFIMEHCTMEKTGGLLIEQWQGAMDAPLLIRYNKSLNVDKRRGDGSTGDHRAFILISTVRGLSQCEIAWNQSINEPGKSDIEDNINIFNSRGASKEKPFRIHDNYIDGASPFDLITHFTGSGITVDGTPDVTDEKMVSAFIEAYNNIVIRCCNAAMNIAAGNNVRYHHNTMLSSGKFANGVESNLFWGGCCLWDGSNVGAAYHTNSIDSNTIGFVRKDRDVPFPGRQDYVIDSKTPPSMIPTNNTFLPNPITKEMEDAQWAIWQKKLSDNKIVLGPGTNGTVTPPPTANKIKVGQNATIKVQPKNKSGANVPAKAVTITLNGGVLTQGADIYARSFKAVTPGKYTGSVFITTLGAKSITKTFDVEILPADTSTTDNEATDMTISFTVS